MFFIIKLFKILSTTNSLFISSPWTPSDFHFNSWRGTKETISVRAKQASYMYCMRSWNVRRISTAELKLWRMKLRIREIFIFINSVMPFLWYYCCSINGSCCVWLKFSCFPFSIAKHRILQRTSNEDKIGSFQHNKVIFIQFWLQSFKCGKYFNDFFFLGMIRKLRSYWSW